ncbi:MAG: PAS domain S-box protein [Anaerolineales bacterium]|nr:PAS domain S-box protein [Anaerolineales bacterium]
MPEKIPVSPWRRILNPRQSLRAQAALAFGALTILLAVLISVLIEQAAQADLRAANGDKLAELSFYMADALDRDVFTRYKELELMSLSTPLSNPEASLASRQRVLAGFLDIYPHYAWVGFVDLSGEMLISVGDRPGSETAVSNLEWFAVAKERSYVGDLYVNLLNEAVAHYVTIAIPLVDENGQQIGVLGTYLDEAWIGEIEGMLLLPSQDRSNVNIMVLAEDGRYLFGTHQDSDIKPCEQAAAVAQSGQNDYEIIDGSDGNVYLTGYATVTPHAELAGPNWLVLACQEASVAMAPVLALQQRVLLVGISLSILFLLLGWVVAGRITQPLAAIAGAANRLRQGEADAEIPIFSNADEVGMLSHSLHDLVSSLAQRTAELGSAETELEEVNNTLNAIIQSVPLAIFLLDPEGVAHAWNPAAREMFGLGEGRSSANPLQAMQHEPDFHEMVTRVLGGEVLTNVERQHTRHDGTPMHVSVAMAPIHDAQGQPTGAVTVLADVTERKKAETQLREAHRTLAILMSNLPGMAYRRRPDDRHVMTFVSEGCFALTGYTREALLENGTVHYADLIHPDDLPGVLMEIEQAVVEKRPYQATYRITTAADHVRWVWEQGEAVYGEDGTLQALEGFITDNTGQVMAQRELEQRVADRTRKLLVLNDVLRLTNTTDDLADILLSTIQRLLTATQGEMGYIHLVDSLGNLHLTAQDGLPATIAEKVASMPVDPPDRACSWVAAHNAVLTIPQVRENELTEQLVDISDQLNAYIGVPLVAGAKVVGVLSLIGQSSSQFGDEEVDLMLAVGRQIGNAVETARLRQQEGFLMVLQERNRLARDLHDSVTQSLYSVVLFAEAGRRKLVAGEVEQATTYLERVNDTGQQALKEMRLFIHKLRPLALQEEGLDRALAQRLKAVEGRSGIDNELIVEGPLDLPPDVEEALYHISMEALNNSLKHARAKKVTVRLAVSDLLIEMGIQDDGRGFDVAETAVSSDGIGLKSMRERVEQFGGTVTLHSASGQGTTVRVSLPVPVKKSAAAAPKTGERR